MKPRKRILLMAVAAALAVFTVGCSFSVSTAKIEDAIMTNSIDENGMPGEEVFSYTPDVPAIYTSAKILNAPDNTQIRIVWTYVTGSQKIDEVTLDSGTIANRYISSHIEPYALLPEGDYQVEFFVNDRSAPDATVKFVVTAGESGPGASDTADLAGYEPYSQAEGGFSVLYPADWILADMKEDNAAMFYPEEYVIDEQDEVNAVIVAALKGNAEGYTLETALQTWIEETEAEGLSGYRHVDQAIDTINGTDIASYVYGWTRDGYALYTVDAIAVRGDNLYLLTLTATQETFDTLYPQFEQMVLSFNIL